MTKPLSTNLFCSSIGFVRSSSSSKNGFLGRRLVVERQKGKAAKRDFHAVPVKMDHLIAKGMRWWEKGLQPNMKEIISAQDLVDSLMHAGDKLVIVDFFSPGCAGCKSLHPKICQFAGQNPHILFLPVNYEKHKSMCYSLNVHVLPFFRFYRGAHGRLCSFSCTNATIKKFKDALAKHNTDRSGLGPAKGLEEKELLALAASRDLCFDQTKKERPLSGAPEAMEPVSALL
ncbi:thioredoxin-like 1-2, chloroplastic isoform X2 [Phalaenopsis equestris]|nr:thioredoxin-like 1-2, chloroplastic isoform X2 [Phalaenopsis equestris]